MSDARAALGFTVKSGWAAAVLVTGTATSPRVSASARVELSDPELPEARQPYHAGFATARTEGPELSRLVASVRRFGRRAVGGFIRECGRSFALSGAGLVVGSTIDPARIGNEHIRIHALEGQLFRSVVEDAAGQCDLAASVWRERDLHAAAAQALGRREDDLRTALTTLGRGTDGPWRAEQKAAALAAWLVLSRR
jgi:hypothetical protein